MANVDSDLPVRNLHLRLKRRVETHRPGWFRLPGWPLAVGTVFDRLNRDEGGRPSMIPGSGARSKAAMLCGALGGGVIGNTTGSGPVIEGSSPSPRAKVGYHPPKWAPSSSGLGRRPLKPVTPVRIRSGLPTPVAVACTPGSVGGGRDCPGTARTPPAQLTREKSQLPLLDY